MNRVLISAYTGIGNFILKTPVIKKIKDIYPNSKIDIIAGNVFGTEFLLKDNKLVNNIYILNENDSFLKKIIFFLNLRQNNYDLIFLPFDAFKKFLYFGSYLSNIKKRVVHINIKNTIRNIIFYFMPQTLIVPLLGNRHEIDLNYDLLEFYLNKPISRNYETFLSIKYCKDILSRFDLVEKKFITIQVGAANGAKSPKKWSLDNFKKLIKHINKKYNNYKIVIVGDKGDYENDIKNLENQNLNFINTAGLTSINDVINLLYYSKLVIAHDSGIMHIANALECDLIALYGPTDHTRTKPLGKKSKILYSKSPGFCKMFNFNENESELYNKYPNCMDGITVEIVISTIEEIISK